MKKYFAIVLTVLFIVSCQEKTVFDKDLYDFGAYSLKPIELSASLSELGTADSQIVELLCRAAMYADSMFLYESAGDYACLYGKIQDPVLRERFRINFGPWDRFLDNVSFIDTIEDKPLGAAFYPSDMVKSEFLRFKDIEKMSPYTFIRRDSAGKLYCVPYHQEFKAWNDSVADLLTKAAALSSDTVFATYLLERSNALRTDNYYKSDSVWLRLNSKIDFVFGPVDIREDRLYNLKAEHKALVLVKDEVWSRKMEMFNKWLVYLQKALPVDEEYRKDEPGEASKIVVYDVVRYGGSAWAGQPDISGVYPFYHDFQLKNGVKNVQLKNAIEAKFRATIEPIADEIFVYSQRKYVTDSAFFVVTLMYDMANSLGPRYTVKDHVQVRKALKDKYVVFDYLKNAVLSLFLIEKFYSLENESLLPGQLQNYYYTFVADMFRQIRWGNTDDYSLAYLVLFNYLNRNGVFSYIPSGQVLIHFEKLRETLNGLTPKILVIMGDGDYVEASKFIVQNSMVPVELENVINQMNAKNIPLDITVKSN